MSNLATVERFFTRYAAAFDAFDPEAIASFYHVPCMMIRAGEVATLSTRSAVLANMKALVSLHRSRGYTRFRNTYEMVELDGQWRIVVSSTHESGGVGT